MPAATAGVAVPLLDPGLSAQVGMAAFERASRAWAGDPDVDLATLIARAAGRVLALGGT